MAKATKTINAQDSWSDEIEPGRVARHYGHLGFTVIIPDSSTVTIQRDLQEGFGWRDVYSFTSSDEGSIYDPSGNVKYRIGVKSGNYDSGSVKVGLYQ